MPKGMMKLARYIGAALDGVETIVYNPGNGGLPVEIYRHVRTRLDAPHRDADSWGPNVLHPQCVAAAEALMRSLGCPTEIVREYGDQFSRVLLWKVENRRWMLARSLVRSALIDVLTRDGVGWMSEAGRLMVQANIEEERGEQ